MSEAIKFGGSPHCVGSRLARLLDQVLLFDEAAEVRLVYQPSGKRLDGALQLQEREDSRHELEHDGPVFDLGAKAANARCQDATMIRYHRRPGYRQGSSLPQATGRFFDQGRLVEEFIALQRKFLIPVTTAQSEGE